MTLLISHKCLKSCPHCKWPGQIDGAAWPSGLVEQLKSPGVDDKLSSFIASNKANQLRHLVWLNVGKCQKKKSVDFLVFNFFQPQFSSSTPPPLPHKKKSQSQDPQIRNIATSSNIFENSKFSKMLDKDAILQIQGSCDCDGGKLDDKNRGQKNWKQILKNDGQRHNIANSRVVRLRWRKLNDENHGRKNWKRWFDFFGFDFHHPTSHTLPPPPSQLSQDPQWGMKITPKKSKTSVWFFQPRFSTPRPHRNQCSTFEFAILNLRRTPSHQFCVLFLSLLE